MNTAMHESMGPGEAIGGTSRFPQLPPVPRARYLDREFYELEIEHIFKKTWLLVGIASEFPEAGSYRLLDLPFAPVVVLRDKAGQMRAYLNSCQHRGATVLREKAGCAKYMTCQYHGWVYGLDGRLVSVTNAENFPGLKVDEYALVNLRCEQWGELIYINFDRDAEPLLDFLAPYARRYPQWTEMRMQKVGQLSSEVACNWKAMVDAFYESYHLPYIHKTTAANLVAADQIVYELYPGGHGNKVTPYHNQAERAWDKVNDDRLPRVCDRHGNPAFDESSHAALCMFPNVDFILTPRVGIGYLTIWPLAPDRCRLDYTLMAEDRPGDDRAQLFSDYLEQMQSLLDEDMANMCSIQRSLEADPGKGVVLGSEEVILYNFHAEIDRRIGVAREVPENLRVPDALRSYVMQ